MKIIYIANMRVPTEKAHGVQIMKTCEAFVELGHQVELLVPERASAITTDPFEYYDLRVRFTIHRLPVRDTIGTYGKLGFYIESFSFARAVRKYLRGAPFDVLYGRDEHILACLRQEYVWESHTGAWNAAARRVARRAQRIVAISQGLKDFYVARGVSSRRVLVAPDGVDLAHFQQSSQADARARLDLSASGKIAMYIGRLDGWKGVETLLEASSLLADLVTVVIIGGEPAQIKTLSAQYPQVTFLGSRPYRELSDHMAAADVLILPNTGKNEISKTFTSPLKLFAYMASGVPIVASDLPSLREVLDEDSATLVRPDSPEALASGIRRALVDGATQAARALALVQAYTWHRRAERILAACVDR
jgi:glycosyltransferase involved in cell wall biosynthesis